MTRTSVALCVVAALLAGACAGTTEPPVAMAVSDAPRSSADAPGNDVADVAASVEAMGADLYGVLDDGNVVFSPESIMTALAMAYAGARGVTAQEMAAVLHIGLEDQEFHAGMNALDLALESRNSRTGDEHVELRVANSLWGQEGLTFQTPFLDTLATDYGAGMRLVDFKAAAEAARVQINQWVGERTNGKITDLIPEGALDTLTRLVLVNAVYLDATWAQPFDPNDTGDGPFTKLDGSSATVPLMHQTSMLAFGTGDGWQAVQLPYSGGHLAMLLVVPDQGHFAEVEARLEAGLLVDAITSLSDTTVALTVPKFTVRTQASVTAPLGALGMRTAFDPDAADFSGMTTQAHLYVSDVIHEAYIAVDEAGTEAAAATAVVMSEASALLAAVILTVDRPFIFALRDTTTGAVLFLGRVTDP